MTPAPKSRLSPASDNLSVKQKRAVQRAQKLEEFHRQKKKAVRNRRIAIIGGAVTVLAIVALLVTSIVLTPKPAVYSAGAEGATIEGAKTYDNSNGHVQTPVNYPQTPPAGGEHSPVWLNCGIYSQPVPNENAVHSLEHAAVWVTYDPSLSKRDIAKLKSMLPSSYAILSPYEGLPSPIVVSAWNAQLTVDSADDPRIAEFFEEYWRSNDVPEPGALCSGGLDAPGKVS